MFRVFHITLFDPKTIMVNPVFDEGLANSTEVQHVLVNGEFVLKNEKIVKVVYPGQPVFGKYKN